MNRRLRLLALVLAILVLPLGYVAVVAVSVGHQPLRFQAAWADPYFQSGWIFAGSDSVSGYLVVSNGVLSIVANSSVTPQDIAGAELSQMPFVNVTQNPFLIVSVKTPSVYVGARVAVLTEGRGWILLLVKTYPDAAWHTEVIDLRFFGLTHATPIVRLELGWIGVQQTATSGTTVLFQDVELASAVGGSG